ncbi:MAG: DNA repair protein RadC [Rhodobacterales bacterium]|nr:MAG: DNA repair protein RadC [Rhodobacterales bacterium]
MFDHSFPAPTAALPNQLPPMFVNAAADTSLAFALTTPDYSPGAAMSGTARPLVLDRFATLAEAMREAVARADQMAFDAPPQMLAILDRDDRLVLAGAATDSAVAWCHPVVSAAEARAVVAEASQLRAQASRAADWEEHGLSQRLRQRADLLEARLVDPLWRAFAARALQVAA